MDLWCSILTERLALLDKKGGTDPAHAPDRRARRQAARKSGCSSDKDSDLYINLVTTHPEEGRRFSRRATPHKGHLATYLGRQKLPRYPDCIVLFYTNPLHAEALLYRNYRLEDFSQHYGPRGTDKVRDYNKQMALKLPNHHFSGEDPITVFNFLIRFVREANIRKMSEIQLLLA